MYGSLNWVGLTITGLVIAALGFGARLASDGWIKTALRWTFFAVLFVVVWNLTALLIARREG